MKIKYYEWKCVGCGETKRFTGGDTFSPFPYWFTIRTEGCVSLSEQPSFNTCACSTTCLGKSAMIIDGYTKKGKSHLIPNKKEIEATICNQCGKVAKVDALNMIIGPGPLRDWTFEVDPSGRKDFCCDICKKNYTLHPEESVFNGLKFENPWDIRHLLRVIDSPNLREVIKPAKPKFFTTSSITEAIAKANGKNGKPVKKPKSGSS